MFRLSNTVASLFVTASITASAYAASDDVAEYLEQHGLHQVLVIHLEDKLAEASDYERDDLVLRIAGLYAQLLQNVTDAEERAATERRARALLAQVPASSAEELRVALLQGAFLSIDRTAENHWLRLASAEQLEAARRDVQSIIPDVMQLLSELEAGVEVLDRQRGRASPSQAVVLQDEIERRQRLVSQCRFLAAWSLLYDAWLNEKREQARTAEKLFAEVMGLEDRHVLPEEVSVDLRSLEYIARSILGMALSRSLSLSTVAAEPWIELLKHPQTYEPLREQADTWKLAILLDRASFAAASRLVETMREAAPLDVTALRLIAVHTLEHETVDVDARELAQFAFATLASRGELQQVLDLASRYGTTLLGSQGFAVQYVKGVLAYHEAREIHKTEYPTSDPDLLDQYSKAEENLLAALNEADAAQYPDAVPACQRLAAMCQFFQGHFLDARRNFEAAAAELPATDAAESMWMAIVCLDRIIASSDNETLENEQAQLIDRFLKEFPSSEYGPRLVLRRAVGSNDTGEETLEQLIAIPPNSDVYTSARQRAAEILFTRYRQGDREQRAVSGGEFVVVAKPLQESAAAQLSTGDSTAASRFLALSRRLLEVALSREVDQPRVAREVLESINREGAITGIELDELRTELTYRRAQLALAEDRVTDANQIANELWQEDSELIWSRLAARAMFHHLSETLRGRSEPDESELEMIVTHGGRVIREFDDTQGDALPENAWRYMAAVADASEQLYQQTGNLARGQGAMFLYERLLKRYPTNETFLRVGGLLAKQLEQYDLALDCWRKLVAGLSTGDVAWFEAKFHLIDVLRRKDPVRARQVLDQHTLLYPEYGPAPWGAMLKGLDVQIPADRTTGGDGAS